MRQTIALAIAAAIAIYGTTGLIAQSAKHPRVATTSASFSITQLTLDAKNLPEQAYDAY